MALGDGCRRDVLAGMALQGILSGSYIPENAGIDACGLPANAEEAARLAVEMADALTAKLDHQPRRGKDEETPFVEMLAAWDAHGVAPGGLIDAIEGEMNPLGGGRLHADYVASAVMHWLKNELLGKERAE